MKTKTILLIIGGIAIQLSSLSAEAPIVSKSDKQITERDFKVAHLLHNISEFSVQAEKIDKKNTSNGGKPSSLDSLPVANLKRSIKRLEALVDVPSFRDKLAKKLEKFRKSGLGPNHPERRWLELLSRSLDKYSKPKN